MARYIVHVRTPMPPTEAFAYMADLTNFAEWDPGVDRVEQVEGDGAGAWAPSFDVAVKVPGRTMTLRYDTVAFDDASTSMTAFAENALLTSEDTITVKADGNGSIVTYDAELKLKGLLGLSDPLLGLTFNQIGDRAAAGLVETLAGERVAAMNGRSGSPTRSSRRRSSRASPAWATRHAAGWPAGRRWTTTTSPVGSSSSPAPRRGSATRPPNSSPAAARRSSSSAAPTSATSERVTELVATTGNPSITQVAADMGDLDQVRHLAERVLADHDRLDVLIHNAGALDPERRIAPDGTEATVASQVVGPFLLTSLLLDRLVASAPARVLTMSSGGMYATGLRVSGLEMTPEDYNGTEQYARAKRAQVTLNEMWAERYGDRGITFHALHPGWADTPGVDAGLPTFAKVMGPFLRTPEQGADTLVWLAADDAALESNGRFWLDRVSRPIHKLPTTKKTDTAERRQQLWNLVTDTANATTVTT